jgi:hypothetical protein
VTVTLDRAQISRFGVPTSVLIPLTCSLRVRQRALPGFADGCKTRINKPVSFLLCPGLHRIALAVVSEWCQLTPTSLAAKQKCLLRCS